MNSRRLTILLLASTPAFAAELHVSVSTGDNTGDGSSAKPFRSIMAAAAKAQPGDTVTVHEGVYRERVDPPRGGESDTKRIVYAAARGEKVVITGAEPVTGWTREQGDTWKVVIPGTFFTDGVNPFADLIDGDWFNPNARRVHTGAVYLNGHWIAEARGLGEVQNPKGKSAQFFAQVDGATKSTTLWARFPEKDPNKESVEVSVRQTVFYPSKNYINYITVRGFTLQQAAPNWAPPTVEQKAVVGPNWAKGWIIEDNLIRYSACCGVSLGKFNDDISQNGGPGYKDWNITIDRALKNGWNKATVGGHIVRNNEIRDCDEIGIVGAFGCAYGIIERNHIHDIGVRNLLRGAELGGIKFHGAVDTLIRDNWIHHCSMGMHMDWMTQGTQITGNLMHNNDGRASGKVGFYEAGGGQDIFLEVNNAPCVVANNVLLSSQSVFNASHGAAFAHNLMRGISPTTDRWRRRKTPWLEAHGTQPVGQYDNRTGDDRFFNNIFAARSSLGFYNAKTPLPTLFGGNVFTKGTVPSSLEKTPLLAPDFEPKPAIEIRNGEAWLRVTTDAAWAKQKRPLVTGALLGKTVANDLPYENPNGSPVTIDTDYFGKKYDAENPFPGPFATPVNGEVKVWPKQ